MHSNDNYENKKQQEGKQLKEGGCRQQEDKHNPSSANEVATTITQRHRLSTRIPNSNPCPGVEVEVGNPPSCFAGQ